MGRPEIESTDHIQGIAPVPLRVRLDPGKPGKIIAVPKLLKSNTRGDPSRGDVADDSQIGWSFHAPRKA